MENVINDSSFTATPAVDEDAPVKTLLLPKKGWTRKLPLNRVIVYDRGNQSIKVQPEDSLDCWSSPASTLDFANQNLQ